MLCRGRRHEERADIHSLPVKDGAWAMPLPPLTHSLCVESGQETKIIEGFNAQITFEYLVQRFKPGSLE